LKPWFETKVLSEQLKPVLARVRIKSGFKPKFKTEAKDKVIWFETKVLSLSV